MAKDIRKNMTETNTPSFCPQCGLQLVNVGAFRICPVHGQLPEQKPFIQLRIFLSYGHDANEELVRQIKTDMEQRGHDVWFDKNNIRTGDDWRRAITDGILNSHRVISFLSKHSTRDPGVCRDEIAIAIGVKDGNIQTILVESETEVQPPVNIGHIQWLDMHDWKEKKSVGEVAWNDWYQEKLREIIRVVESEESQRFAGEIEKLSEYLKPIRSDARIYDLLKKGYYGREWLFETVEKWRTGPPSSPGGKEWGVGSSRLFRITGDPGVGKSAFAARLTHTRSDAIIAAQFVEWDKPDHRDARRVVRSIAFQLATRLPDYRKLLLTLPEISELDRKDASELFSYLLANPLKNVIHGGRERYLIIIDALDEAGESGRNPLVEMLARHASLLPGWIGIVVTSRPESAVTGPLQGLNPVILDTKTEDNKEDIRQYLRHQLANQFEHRQNAVLLLNAILDKSEGVFLYIERFCEDVRLGYISLDHPEQFPQGLGEIFYHWFKRQFPDPEKFKKEVRPALRAILAAREPLPLEILQKLFNWQDEELRDFTRMLGSLFPVTKEADGEVIKPYHKSIADWLGDEGKAGEFFISEKEGHKILAEQGWCEFLNKSDNLHDFFLCHLASDLIKIGDTERLFTILANSIFWKRSPVFSNESFYKELTILLSDLQVINAVNPAINYYTTCAKESSPERLGYTLFPHEPGVVFKDGTLVRNKYSCEYWIPKGAIEPPSEVLWAFLTTCARLFVVTSALLKGVGSLKAIEWYNDLWTRSKLNDMLNSIDYYYNGCYQHLSDKAGELSWQIDEAAKNII